MHQNRIFTLFIIMYNLEERGIYMIYKPTGVCSQAIKIELDGDIGSLTVE